MKTTNTEKFNNGLSIHQLEQRFEMVAPKTSRTHENPVEIIIH